MDINQKNLADIIGIDEKTFYRWRKQGMPFVRKSNTNQIFFQKAPVLKFISNSKKEYLDFFQEAFRRLEKNCR